MIFIHDRMADNGSQFAASLHQMHEDLLDLAANAERGRKGWKTTGMAAEQKVADLEQSMRKSKAKYDSLAEEYDRARTGEARPGGGKVLGAFKAHKSAAQQEEDLLKKVQAADQTYQGHVNALLAEKSHLVSSARPEAVKALQELIAETDSGVTLQMQKFGTLTSSRKGYATLVLTSTAAFNEKLLLGNGLIVSPFKSPGGENTSQPRSLRQAVAAIDNVRDLNEFVAAQHTKVQPSYEVKYERNPVRAHVSAPSRWASTNRVADPQPYDFIDKPDYTTELQRASGRWPNCGPAGSSLSTNVLGRPAKQYWELWATGWASGVHEPGDASPRWPSRPAAAVAAASYQERQPWQHVDPTKRPAAAVRFEEFRAGRSSVRKR